MSPNYAASKLTVTLFSLDSLQERALEEYREAAYGVGFLVLAMVLWRSFAKLERVSRVESGRSRLGHPVRT